MMKKVVGFKTKSPAGRIVGSGFIRSAKSMDAVMYSRFGGYKMKKK